MKQHVLQSAKLYCFIIVVLVIGLVFGVLIGPKAITTLECPEPLHSAYSRALHIFEAKEAGSNQIDFGLHIRHVYVGKRSFAMVLPWPQSKVHADVVHEAIYRTGYYSLIAAAFGCRVIAFDGNLEALSYLRMSVFLNQYDGLVRIMEAIVSNDTDVQFDGWNAHPKTVVAPAYVANRHLTSRAVKLDDIVQEPVLYAKVDVEVWEPSVFASAARMFQQAPPLYVFFEMTYYLDGTWQYDYLGVMNQLREAGYTCRSEVLGSMIRMPSNRTEFDQLLTNYTSHLCKPPQHRFCQDEYFCVHFSAAYVPPDMQRNP